MTYNYNDNNKLLSLTHAIGASFVLTAIYTICLYLVEPLADNLLSWYVSHYVSFLDNSHSLNDVTIVEMILRALLAIICSGYAGFFAGSKLFPKQNPKQTILLSIVLIILVPVLLVDIGLSNR